MSSLQIWTVIIILYQTLISIIISWWTLGCHFAPDSSELHEVTLIKLLYLYDPEACGRIHFYNVTVTADGLPYSTIMWPVKNHTASNFRGKIRLWLSIHVLWLVLAIANITHGRRPCGFYAALVPFTLTGLAMLIIDLVYMVLFLRTIEVTGTEINILRHISSDLKTINWISQPASWSSKLVHEDTSWIALLFAYVSIRGVVQWIINFWLIKDNYFEGVAEYHRLQKEKSRQRSKV